MQEVYMVIEVCWGDSTGTSREVVDIYETEEYAKEIAAGFNETHGYDSHYSSQEYEVEKRVVKKRLLEITREMVQELRNQTGEGIMACNKALRHSNGDMDKAKDYLRMSGTLCI